MTAGGQDRTEQDRTGQDRTGQDRTGQDRTGQDRTGQDRTGLDNSGVNGRTKILPLINKGTNGIIGGSREPNKDKQQCSTVTYMHGKNNGCDHIEELAYNTY